MFLLFFGNTPKMLFLSLSLNMLYTRVNLTYMNLFHGILSSSTFLKHSVKNPDELVMPIRMCMMLWGLEYYLKYKDARVCERLLPTAIKLLQIENPNFLLKYPKLLRKQENYCKKQTKNFLLFSCSVCV